MVAFIGPPGEAETLAIVMVAILTLIIEAFWRIVHMNGAAYTVVETEVAAPIRRVQSLNWSQHRLDSLLEQSSHSPLCRNVQHA